MEVITLPAGLLERIKQFHVGKVLVSVNGSVACDSHELCLQNTPLISHCDFDFPCPTACD